MSQSAFSAVLVGVTALLRRSSLRRGRGCGFCTLASAASRSDLAAHGFGFRCFSLRLRCSWLRLPRLAALGSPLLAPTCLPVASTWLLVVSTSLLAALGSLLLASTWLPGISTSLLAALGSLLMVSAWLPGTSAFVACRTEFAAHGFGLAARDFGLRRLPH